MNKTQIKKRIDELSRVFSSKKSIDAIKILHDELKILKEVEAGEDKKELTIPLEIENDLDKVALFTDGACRGNPGPGSWAFMIQQSDGKLLYEAAACEKLTTNNKMELKAIIEGLEQIKKMNDKLDIFVYTDSKYAVDGIKSWMAGWKKRGWKKADKKTPENLILWQKLDELNGELKIHLHWVKGHSGHPQNEYVDQMANVVLDENGF